MEAYGHSKLANLLHAKELAKRLENTGISVYALHPGIIATEIGADFVNKMSSCTAAIYTAIFKFTLKTPFHGAQTTLYCCLEDKIENESGNYYSGCRKINPQPEGQDMEQAKKLWEISEKLVGLNEQ